MLSKTGSHAFDWSIGPTLFAKPRDTITWARHQMRSPTRILWFLRKISDFFLQKFFSIFFSDLFKVFNFNYKLNSHVKTTFLDTGI